MCEFENLKMNTIIKLKEALLTVRSSKPGA